jgi:hypothetical protein
MDFRLIDESDRFQKIQVPIGLTSTSLRAPNHSIGPGSVSRTLRFTKTVRRWHTWRWRIIRVCLASYAAHRPRDVAGVLLEGRGRCLPAVAARHDDPQRWTALARRGVERYFPERSEPGLDRL